MKPFLLGGALVLAACRPDLSGRWTGQMNCGGEELWDFAMDLDEQGLGTYTGPGAAEVMCDNVADWCTLGWETTLVVPGTGDTQELDMALVGCAVDYQDERYDVTCYEPKYVVLRDGWKIEGYFDNCIFAAKQ
jgi:hypothetical protein